MSTLLSKSINSNKQRLINVFNILIVFVVGLFLFKLLSVCNRAIDFIDEGFYLNWISNPWIYDFFTTQFGFIYYPLYQLVGGDLIFLRQSNTLITFLLAYFLISLLLSSTFKNLDKYFLVAISLAVSSASFLILIRTDYWIPTPSYNTLTFHGAIIFFSGLILNHYRSNKTNYTSVALIGLGGWLVFMGKPPSAVLLAAVWLFSVLLSNRNKQSVLTVMSAGIVAGVLLLLTAYLISGSVFHYVVSLSNGLNSLNIFDAGHAKSVLALFRVDQLHLSMYAKFLLTILSLYSFLVLRSACKTNSNSIFIYLQALVFLILGALITLAYFNFKFLLFRFYLLSIFAMTIAMHVALYLSRHEDRKPINRERYVLAFIAFCMPYLLAIGSNNNYWQLSSSAGFFWVISLFLLIEQTDQPKTVYKKLALIATLVLFLVQAIIFTSQLMPYNQLIPLKKVRYSVKIRDTEQTFYVRKDTKKYIEGLYAAAEEKHFTKGTALIDMTGHYGTSVYLLGAKSIGLASYFGGYNGSNEYAAFALNHVSCKEIASAWLLIEKNGYRVISESVLKNSANITVDSNYEYSKPFLSIINSPNSMWQSAPTKQYEHFLLKPTNVIQQTQNCLAYRKVHQINIH